MAISRNDEMHGDFEKKTKSEAVNACTPEMVQTYYNTLQCILTITNMKLISSLKKKRKLLPNNNF